MPSPCHSRGVPLCLFLNMCDMNIMSNFNVLSELSARAHSCGDEVISVSRHLRFRNGLPVFSRKTNYFQHFTWCVFGWFKVELKSHSPTVACRLNLTENRAGSAEQVTHFVPFRVGRYAVHASCHAVSQPPAPQIKYRYDLCPLSQPSHHMFSCTGAVGHAQL